MSKKKQPNDKKKPTKRHQEGIIQSSTKDKIKKYRQFFNFFEYYYLDSWIFLHKLLSFSPGVKHIHKKLALCFMLCCYTTVLIFAQNWHYVLCCAVTHLLKHMFNPVIFSMGLECSCFRWSVSVIFVFRNFFFDK